MAADLRNLLSIPNIRLDEINSVLLDSDQRIITDILDVVNKYGSPDEINNKAQEARKLPNLLKKVNDVCPGYVKDLNWLTYQQLAGAFCTIAEYRNKILGSNHSQIEFNNDFAVTLEVSALQYFPWVCEMAESAIKDRTLIPGRFIAVRKMKESEADGDLPAIIAALSIMGASFVETLDTKGTDGSNIHLGGPDTITGYFGGVGQPNAYPLKWLDEFLYYYTNYGLKEVLNINPGTVLASYLLYKLGINIEFKISVFMGNDNPYAAFWTLICAKLFSRDDGSTPLIGFNWSNSINNESMEIAAQFRKSLGFEELIRFEHHITETWKSIVRQPYNRRDELIELADHVANISAKHEGGDPEIDSTRAHPSDILDYFRDKSEVIASGDWDNLKLNFFDKVNACNKTAEALTRNGLSFIPATNLHK
ncbi:MAG: hypothetical protein A2X25_10945 [Chloroflexi bacterium GWB2_49_20]|nr:MAG: hypothetical protein A2X25_10945 [Chloroflexi bacterium GWB2_49_20]OGN78927.1 MAG: hypothetical protein A2X26_00410 [Chloroflexi bacterium GWC2_49_37]OGN86312.1 MAG: hypothetical protein A2X27_05370 [Chloroflexi bacterium GWD2_49_16]HBG74540.1 hypothetical protein [Anaerolineae bacterium]